MVQTFFGVTYDAIRFAMLYIRYYTLLYFTMQISIGRIFTKGLARLSKGVMDSSDLRSKDGSLGFCVGSGLRNEGFGFRGFGFRGLGV